ncbi:MAG: transporter substrate-binding domain-containing protein [Anaerolineae bacterium]
MLMKRRFTLLFVLTAILVLPGIQLLAQDAPPGSRDPARPGGRAVTIAVENAYAPYNYLDNDGKGIGWDYDTFHDICRLLNCVPEFQQMAWDGMLLAVSQGQVDVAADGITYTEERDETVDFSTLSTKPTTRPSWCAATKTASPVPKNSRSPTTSSALSLAPPTNSLRRKSSATLTSSPTTSSQPQFRR